MQPDQPDQNHQHRDRTPVRRFILAQLVTAFVLSAVLLIYGITAAYSSLAGGLIATIANTWFAVKVFRHSPKQTPQAVLALFYIGEIYKVVLTAAMFVIVFVLIKPLNVVALLSSYLIVHLTPAVVNVSERNDPVDASIGQITDKES